MTTEKSTRVAGATISLSTLSGNSVAIYAILIPGCKNAGPNQNSRRPKKNALLEAKGLETQGNRPTKRKQENMRKGQPAEEEPDPAGTLANRNQAQGLIGIRVEQFE